MLFLRVDSSPDDRFGLHLCNFGICYGKTASAMAHHRVELMQACNDVFDRLNALALRVSQQLDVFLRSGNKLMQRRIQETDAYRISFQRFVELLKVALLVRQDLVQRGFAFFGGIGTDHFPEGGYPFRLKEHMFRTAKADTFRSEFARFL